MSTPTPIRVDRTRVDRSQGGSLLVSLPMGVLMVLVLAAIALVVWHLPGQTSRTVPEESS